MRAMADRKAFSHQSFAERVPALDRVLDLLNKRLR